MNSLTKLFIALGILFLSLGVVWHFTDGNIPLGKLPGDIKYKTNNGVIYIPITSCILVSGLLSLINYLFRKF